MKIAMISVLLSTFWVGQAFSLGFPPEAKSLRVSESYDFEGIVALSNCSGSLVKFDDSDDQDFGMILTNGHCVAMMNPGVVYSNRSSSKSFTILSKDASNLGSVRASRLLYATLTDTDMGIYELRKTFAQIRDEFGIEALILDRNPPSASEPIEIISGYWKRGYSCNVDKTVFNLKEGKWTFKDSIRYSQPGCEVIGGTSGSPILAAGTKTVVGVNNTGNQSGRRCTVNNPCEIDEDGDVFYEKGQNYGQQTFWLYSCRNDSGDLDLSVDGCLLPKP